MSAYCVDFNGGSDWYAPASQSDNFWDLAGGCSRAWVVIESSQFQGIYNASVSGGTGGTGGTTSPQFTTEEVAALKYMAANPSPFNLSVEDGYLVSGSIVGVWVVAWAFRALYLTLRSDGEPTE